MKNNFIIGVKIISRYYKKIIRLILKNKERLQYEIYKW